MPVRGYSESFSMGFIPIEERFTTFYGGYASTHTARNGCAAKMDADIPKVWLSAFAESADKHFLQACRLFRHAEMRVWHI